MSLASKVCRGPIPRPRPRAVPSVTRRRPTRPAQPSCSPDGSQPGRCSLEWFFAPMFPTPRHRLCRSRGLICRRRVGGAPSPEEGIDRPWSSVVAERGDTR